MTGHNVMSGRARPHELRVALVTGAARGIGRAIAMQLAQEGASVAVNDIDLSGAVAVAEALAEAGARSVAAAGDVSSSDTARDVVEQASRALGPVDVLVNNASLVTVHKAWTEISVEDWDSVLAVNLRSNFLLARLVAVPMIHRGWGRIVNIGSIVASAGHERLLHYTSSKAAVEGFTRALARELGGTGVTVNTVAPGGIKTEAEIESVGEGETVDAQLIALQAVKRRGTPDDVAAAVSFFASAGAGFVTGQTLNVDGGWIFR